MGGRTASQSETSAHVDVAAAATTRRPACLVLQYHYVHDVEPIPLPRPGARTVLAGVPAPSTAEFRRQLDALCAALEPIDWPRLYAFTTGRATLPDRCFLLTFDGGLADHARHVAPILHECGVHGAFFVPGTVMLSHRLLPGHTLQLLLSIFEPAVIEEQIRAIVDAPAGATSRATTAALPPQRDSELRCNGGVGIDEFRLRRLLNQALSPRQRDAALLALFERHVGASARWARHWYLSWDDLVGLQAQGHTIGAEGFRGEPITTLSTGERTVELIRAKATLDEGLGLDLRPLAYPQGAFDDDCLARCRAAGFSHAFTTREQWLTRQDQPFALPRVNAGSLPLFLARETVGPPST